MCLMYKKLSHRAITPIPTKDTLPPITTLKTPNDPLQSILSPLDNQATKTYGLQTAPLGTIGAPLAMTNTAQMWVLHYDAPPPP